MPPFKPFTSSLYKGMQNTNKNVANMNVPKFKPFTQSLSKHQMRSGDQIMKTEAGWSEGTPGETQPEWSPGIGMESISLEDPPEGGSISHWFSPPMMEEMVSPGVSAPFLQTGIGSANFSNMYNFGIPPQIEQSLNQKATEWGEARVEEEQDYMGDISDMTEGFATTANFIDENNNGIVTEEEQNAFWPPQWEGGYPWGPMFQGQRDEIRDELVEETGEVYLNDLNTELLGMNYDEKYNAWTDVMTGQGTANVSMGPGYEEMLGNIGLSQPSWFTEISQFPNEESIPLSVQNQLSDYLVSGADVQTISNFLSTADTYQGEDTGGEELEEFQGGGGKGGEFAKKLYYPKTDKSGFGAVGSGINQSLLDTLMNKIK
jgi:hypothetical protein